MVTLIALGIYAAFWTAIWLLGPARHARATSTPTRQAKGFTAVCALLVRACLPRRTPAPPAVTAPSGVVVTPTGNRDELAWSALDDLQLTRLLSNAARGTTA